VCDVTNSNSPVSKLEFRQALYLSLEREKLVSAVLKGAGAVAYSIIPPGILGHNPGARIAGSLKEAKEMLAKAGFPDGRGVPTLTLTYRQSSELDLVMQAIQQMWNSNLGIRVNLVPMERRAFNTWQDSIKSQRYDLHSGTWGSDYLDPFNWHNFLFASKVDYYNSHWSDPEFDRLVDQGAGEVEVSKRKEIHERAEGILVRSAAVIPVYRTATPYLIKPWVVGFRRTPLGFDRFGSTSIRRR
jgi:oligopeptide transport system substrate-binding protein